MTEEAPVEIEVDDEQYEGDSPRDRNKDVAAMALNPLTLLGSYFRAPDGDGFREGLVVGQPFAGPTTTYYLVEIYGNEGASGYQQLVDIEEMLTEKWSFYDTEAWLTMNAKPEGAPAKKPTEYPKPKRRRTV